MNMTDTEQSPWKKKMKDKIEQERMDQNNDLEKYKYDPYMGDYMRDYGSGYLTALRVIEQFVDSI